MKNPKNLLILVGGAVILLLYSLPFWHRGFFLFHDFTHVARLIELQKALDAGNFPALWSQNFGYGYGMPLFMFYGPLPFYVAFGLLKAGLTAIGAVKAVFVLANLATFTGMYCLMRRWGRAAGLLAATVLFTAPYRAVDIFVRGALNETVAIACLPWILHGLWTIPEKPKRGFIITSLALAALLLTHNLTVVMAIPFLLLLGLVRLLLSPARRRWQTWAVLAASGLFAVLLPIGYWLPSIMAKNATIVDSLATGYFDYHIHFLYIRQFFIEHWGYGGSEYGPHDGISFHFGWIAWGLVMAAISTALFSWMQWLRRRLPVTPISATKITLTLVTAVCLATTLFLSLNHSELVWRTIPIYRYIQFPWRFHALSIVWFAMLAGWAITWMKQRRWRWAITVILITVITANNLRFHQPKSYMPDADQRNFTSDQHAIRTSLSGILTDYAPVTFNLTKLQNLPIEPNQRMVVDGLSTPLRYEHNDPQALLAIVDKPLTASTTITWNVAAFPGWKYYVNGVEVQPQITKDGLMQLNWPQEPAIQSIGARLTLMPVQQYALITSGLVVIAWLAIVLPMARHRNS
jgi:hypothetical protein